MIIKKNKFDFTYLTYSYTCTIKNIRPFPRIKLKSIQAVQIKTKCKPPFKTFFNKYDGNLSIRARF